MFAGRSLTGWMCVMFAGRRLIAGCVLCLQIDVCSWMCVVFAGRRLTAGCVLCSQVEV